MVRGLRAASDLVGQEAVQLLGCLVRVPRHGQELRAIAGREHRRLLDLAGANELLVHPRTVGTGHGEALAHVERGGAMAQADEDEVHVAAPSSRTPR